MQQITQRWLKLQPKAATGGYQTLTLLRNAVTSVLNAYGKSADEAAKVTG
jgi:hypothetical protein